MQKLESEIHQKLPYPTHCEEPFAEIFTDLKNLESGIQALRYVTYREDPLVEISIAVCQLANSEISKIEACSQPEVSRSFPLKYLDRRAKILKRVKRKI